MTKKIIFTIISTCLLYLAQGQNQFHDFYQLTRMAKRCDLQNKPDSSLLLYKNAFSKVEYIPEVYLASAIKLSKKLKQKEVYKDLSAKLKTQRSCIDSEYAKEINLIGKADQAVRTSKNMSVRDKYYECIKNGDCTPDKISKLKSVLTKWWNIDSININKLLMQIKTKGFPSEKAVGAQASENAYIIMLHFDKDTNNHILKPILDEALLKGQILPRNYAFIVDRREIFIGRPPYYYCVPFGIEKLTADQLAEVEKRRALIDYGKISETQIIIKTKNSYQVKIIE